MQAFAEALVGAWSPRILVSEQVADGPRLAQFVERAHAGYVAPEIVFSVAEAVTVLGRHFAVLSRDRGLIPDFTHTLGRHEWHELFFGINRCSLHPASEPVPLIIGNSGSQSYYHWTMESVGTILAQRLLDRGSVPLISPPLDEHWKLDLQQIFSIEAPVINVPRDEIAAFDRATLTNLTGRQYSFSPHPAVLQQFVRQTPSDRTAGAPRRLYVSRSDMPGRRRMENEAALCDLLRTYGFTILSMSNLPVADQIYLFKAAELIIAPHGAALTNLVYARDGTLGPQVIELMQESYLGRSFLKIAQAKQLDYCAIVNPDVEGAEYHHHAIWRCDLDLVERTLARL